ncbi:MAG: hypothetical protein IKM24_05240, partial [Clostridia bacterium]|nr:hypothetical protein [Clostridia bacterium]
MNNRKVRFSDRILAIILTVLMVMSVMPVSALAAEVEGSGSQLITNIGDQSFKVGVATEFIFTTQISAEDAGKTVIETSTFDDPTATVEYLEVKDNKWYGFDGNSDGANGFTLSEGETTSTFRVTFTTPGEKTFTAYIQEVDTGAT